MPRLGVVLLPPLSPVTRLTYQWPAQRQLHSLKPRALSVLYLSLSAQGSSRRAPSADCAPAPPSSETEDCPPSSRAPCHSFNLGLAQSYSLVLGSSSSVSVRLALVAKAAGVRSFGRGCVVCLGSGRCAPFPSAERRPKPAVRAPGGRAVACCRAAGESTCDLRAAPLRGLRGDHQVLRRGVRELVALQLEVAPASERSEVRRVA